MDLKVAPLKTGQALDGHQHLAAHSIPRGKNYNNQGSHGFFPSCISKLEAAWTGVQSWNCLCDVGVSSLQPLCHEEHCSRVSRDTLGGTLGVLPFHSAPAPHPNPFSCNLSALNPGLCSSSCSCSWRSSSTWRQPQHTDPGIWPFLLHPLPPVSPAPGRGCTGLSAQRHSSHKQEAARAEEFLVHSCKSVQLSSSQS